MKFNLFIVFIVLLISMQSCKEYSLDQNTKITNETCIIRFVEQNLRDNSEHKVIYYNKTSYPRVAVLNLTGNVASGRLCVGCNDGIAKSYQIEFSEDYNRSFIALYNSYYGFSSDSSLNGINNYYYFNRIRKKIDSFFFEVPDWWSYEMKKKLEKEWKGVRYDTLSPALDY